MHRFFVLLAVAAFAGCTMDFEPKPLPADHPANVQAPEAPRSGTRHLIGTDELSRKTEMQLARKELPNPDFPDSGTSHDMSKMPEMDHSKMKEMPMPSTSASASPSGKEAVEGEMKAKSDAAKSNTKKSAANESTPPAAIYTCRMHPEVNRPAPGKCPICGMTLMKKESGAK